MHNDNGLVSALAFSPSGKTRELAWDTIDSPTEADETRWIHLDYAGEGAQAWLREKSGIDPVIVQALVAHDPRPRTLSANDGLLLIIRGVNLNAGADPEDMVSLRIWAEANRIVTIRHRRLSSVAKIREEVANGIVPKSSSDLVVHIIERLMHQIGTVVDKLDDDVDDMEDKVLQAEDYNLRHKLAQFRRAAIALRRHVAPQREVLARLQLERVSWIQESDRARLREAAERLARIVDELDAAKERALVTSEELTNQLSDIMNRRLYGLSIVAAIFLPLGFITGALGVNLGGIPGTDFQGSFAIMCVLMGLLGTGQLILFRRKGWF